MQTESERKAIVNEFNARAMQDRRRYQARRDMLSDQAHRTIAAAYSDRLSLRVLGESGHVGVGQAQKIIEIPDPIEVPVTVCRIPSARF